VGYSVQLWHLRYALYSFLIKMQAYGQFLMVRQTNDVPPFKNLDSLTCPVEHLAEVVRTVRDHLDRAGLSTTRGDVVTVTSMSPINTVVTHTHVMNLSAALHTQFAEKLDAPSNEVAEAAAARLRRPENDKFLLTYSNLEYLDLNTAYMDSKGRDDAFFTVHGTIAHMPLTDLQQRHIATIFTWPEDVLLRLNNYVWAVFQLACDVTIFPDLDPTLFGFHLYQHFEILLFEQNCRVLS
jgi:hypothetical protein